MHHLRPGRLLCRDQPSFLKRRVAIFKVVSTAPPCVRHHIDPAYHVIALEHLRPFLEWLVFLLTHVPIIEMLKARTGIQEYPLKKWCCSYPDRLEGWKGYFDDRRRLD